MNFSRFVFMRLGGAADPFRSPYNCGDAPEAPDYSAIAKSNEETAKIAKEAADNDLAFRKEQYETLLPYIRNQLQTGSDMSRTSIDIARKSSDRADEQWGYYKDVFQPIERQVAKEAMEAGSAEKQEAAAGEARASMESQFAKRREAAQRELMAIGVNPNSGRFAATKQSNDVVEAGITAGAMTGARRQERDRGVALRAGAANFGRNMPNTSAVQTGTALQAGNAGTAQAGAGVNSALAGAGYVSGGYGTQIGAAKLNIDSNLGMGSLMNQSYLGQMQAYQSDQAGMGAAMGALGTIAAAAMLS